MQVPSFLSAIPTLSALETFASTVVHGGFLGIDIGTSSVKIVQLSKEGDAYVLDTYGEIELGPYGDRDARRTIHLTIDQIATAVLDLIQAVDARSRRGGMAVPYSASLIRVVELPKRDIDQMDKIIASEVKPLIPVPLETVVLNWLLLTDQTTLETSITAMEEKKVVVAPKEKVMLIATQHELLQAYKRIAETDQLALDFLEGEFFSSARACFAAAKGPALIMDLGASSVKVYLMNGSGVVVATHATSLGCEAITDTLMKACEWNFETAENAKRTWGLLKQDQRTAHENAEFQKAIESTLASIYAEVSHVLKDKPEAHAIDPQKIILTGGGALLPGIIDTVQKHFKIETILAQPFAYARAPLILQDVLNDVGPKYAVALGAAFRAIQSK